ncbi:MAG: cytochrome P450 [Corynebacteriales bacterium]|nr:cytochrome P450 [Mycobacteriales bacterium]
MRKNDPVFWEPTLEAWVITRYTDVKAVLSDDRFSVNRNSRIRKATPEAAKASLAACYEHLDKWMIFTDEPAHKKLRSVLGPAYTAAAVRRFVPEIAELVDTLMRPGVANGGMDVIADLGVELTGIINARRVGFPVDMVDQARQWSDDVFLLFGSGIVTEEIVDRALRSLRECHDYGFELLRECDRETDNLINRLASAVDDGIMSEDQVAASCAMLMIGGHEAARHMIGNGLLALLAYPDQLAKFRDQPELADQTIEELLRWGSPPLSSLRCAATDVELDGKIIRQGDFVLSMLRAGNHDPAVFTRPDDIDIERPPKKHLGFGFGLHFCTGYSLATAQVKLALHALVKNNPQLAISQSSLEWIPSLSSRGVRSLPIKFG